MASLVATAEDGGERALEKVAVDDFADVVARLEGVTLDAGEVEAVKRVKRGVMLRGVIALKFPATKTEDLKTMAREWTRGMLEATYRGEKAASGARFATAEDRALAETLAGVYDACAVWCVERLAPALEDRAGDRSGGQRSASAPPSAPAATAEEANRLLKAALASGPVNNFEDYEGDRPAAAAKALTTDVWESLNWRRGALRYYVATVACRLGPKETPLAPDALAAKARDLAPDLEAGVAALGAVLDARGGDALGASVPHGDASAIKFGVYGTTHLLALAFAGELSYLRSLVDEADAAPWRTRSLILAHRYVYVVEILMDGIGWSVDRPKELIALLGGGKALAAALRDEWADAPAKVDAELRRMGFAAGDGDGDDDAPGPGAPAAKAPTAKAKGKGKKKRRG